MYARLMDIIDHLGSPRVLLIGDFMLDEYIFGDADRISPEAPVPVLSVVNREYRAGGAGSVALNLLTLRARVVCAGVTGNDNAGATINSMLEEHGASVAGILAVNDWATTTKQRLVGLAQHRHRQQLIRVDQESPTELPVEIETQLWTLIDDMLGDCDIVCLEDYGKAVLSDRFVRRIIETARDRNLPVVVDPARIHDYRKYSGATCITPNRAESRLATGIGITDLPTMKEAAEKILNCGLESVVLTLDRDGSYAARKDGWGKLIPTRPRLVYDNTGAGDMVLAMLTLAMTAGCTLEEAAALANHAAGLEVEKFGSMPVSREEILSDLLEANQGVAGKVRPIQQIVAEINRRRQQSNQTIVFTNGCFDILHAGHCQYLAYAKSQGDVLVVGMNSDASVKRMKGNQRPVNSQDDRAAVLASLEMVDYVVVFDQDDPLPTIEQVQPDVLVKGADWKDKTVVGREFVEGNGGKVVLAPLLKGRSTSALIDKIGRNDEN